MNRCREDGAGDANACGSGTPGAAPAVEVSSSFLFSATTGSGDVFNDEPSDVHQSGSGRKMDFQMAEVAIPRELFEAILAKIAGLKAAPA